MSKKTEIPLQLRRRTHLLDRVIDNLLPNMYPCDYNSSKHFVEGVLDEIRWFLVDVEELRGVERTDIEDYIFDYKYDEITNYFNERCGNTKKDNLQETIRKVLREESTGQKKLIGLIDEFGLNEAARMLGISMTKLVQLSNSPINSVMAYQLLVDNITNGNLPIRYNEFNIHNTGDGIIGWFCNIKTGHFLPEFIEQISVMATPFWDGGKYTPVEIDWFTLLDDKLNVVIDQEGGGDYYKELKHQTSFENVEELFNWYKEFYLPEVYNMVMNKLLPIVHSDIDDRLN